MVSRIEETEQIEQFKRIAPNRPNLYNKHHTFLLGDLEEIVFKHPYAKMIHEEGKEVIKEGLAILDNYNEKLNYLEIVKKDIEQNLRWLNSIQDYYMRNNISKETAMINDSGAFEFKPSLESALTDIIKKIELVRNDISNTYPSVFKQETVQIRISKPTELKKFDILKYDFVEVRLSNIPPSNNDTGNFGEVLLS